VNGWVVDKTCGKNTSNDGTLWHVFGFIHSTGCGKVYVLVVFRGHQG